MLGKTHVVIGLTGLAGLERVTNLIQPHRVNDFIPVGPFLCITAVILGSLAPDLDSADSALRSELGELGLAVSDWLSAWGVQHRGLTHYGLTTLVVMILSATGSRWLGYPDVGLVFGLGYLSHILADAMTLSGVPLLWPWQREQTFHLLPPALRLRTGGRVEPLLFLVVTALLIYLLPELLPAAWFRLWPWR